MVARLMYFCCISIGILITSTRSLENYNVADGDIIIADNEPPKRIDIKNVSNFTSTPIATPMMIQQGNNLFIKPKFIVDSPFSSYRQSHGLSDSVSVTSKVPGAEISAVIGKSVVPEQPSIVVSPLHPVIPTGIIGDISMPFARVPYQPPIPIIVANSCQTVACPSYVVPVSPYFPRLPEFPVKKPVLPVNIPKPPELPPITLPKLPIQVIIQRPVVPMPRYPILVPSLCPPRAKCIPTDKGSASVPNVFTGIFQKFKNLLTNQLDLTKITVSDDLDVTSDSLMEFPMLCTQGIIAERVVPNIVKDSDVEVFMNHIPPPQLEYFHNYQK